MTYSQQKLVLFGCACVAIGLFFGALIMIATLPHYDTQFERVTVAPTHGHWIIKNNNDYIIPGENWEIIEVLFYDDYAYIRTHWENDNNLTIWWGENYLMRVPK